MYSREKPGVVQKAPSSLHSPPVRPHSSCSSRFAVTSGSSPGSHVPAGISSRRPAGRLAHLADERHLAFGVDGHDRDRARMLNDLALVLAPALDGDREELSLPHDLGRVRLHERSRRARA